MQTVSAIIDKLNGSAAIARETGWAITTIESWKASNFISEWRRPRLVELSAGALAESDFPTVEHRRSRIAKLSSKTETV